MSSCLYALGQRDGDGDEQKLMMMRIMMIRMMMREVIRL
jgi:hypothetical protein